MRKLDKNTLVLLGLLSCLGVMIGLTSVSVPLYRAFCKATGFGGTTQEGKVASAPTKERVINVSFDGNVDSALPWDFTPDVRTIQVKVGTPTRVVYRAHNRSDHTITGSAVFNVQPDKAGLYFDKIQCFCFTKQVLKAGETAELPVEFFIDPALVDDPNENDVKNITLSYTFYLAK